VARFFKSIDPGFASARASAAAAPKSPALHPFEAALLGLTTLHLCFLPWALGAMHPWTQIASAALSGAGFLLAALPRMGTRGPFAARWPITRLLRFPVFWAGMAMLGYIAVQGANPAWRFESNSESWWLEPLAHISWLPSGVDGPYSRSNPWRALTIFGSMWLLVCSIWAGFLRRQSYRSLLTFLVGNATLLAVLGVLQELIVTKRIFWAYRPSSSSFIASFIYRNHAGCYFNLMTALAVGLCWWHYRRAQRGRRDSTGYAVCLAFASMFLGVMVIFSYSRTSIGLLLTFGATVAVAILAGLLRHRRAPRERRDFIPALFAITGLLCVCLVTLRSEEVWKRFAEIVTDPSASVHNRLMAREAAINMFRDRSVFGWGAGCFRYGFPLYAQKYPEIYFSPNKGLLYWEHAHDDLLEFPIEFGIVGLSPLLIIFGHLSWQLIRRRFWVNEISLCIVVGCVLAIVHSCVDFVFQNPAVLLTWAVLLFSALRWAELDQSEGRRTPLPAEAPS
jgi:O-antigen ligase